MSFTDTKLTIHIKGLHSKTIQSEQKKYNRTLSIYFLRNINIKVLFTGFKFKVRLKYEVELYIGSYGKKKDILRNKWAGFQDLLLQEQ